MNTNLLTALVCAVLLSGDPLRAAEVTLFECLNRARAQSLAVVQSNLNEARSLSALSEIQNAKLPQVAGGLLFNKLDTPSNASWDSNRAVLRLEQNVFPYSSAWARNRQKEHEHLAAALTKIETTFDVELSVKQFYLAVLKENDVINSMVQVEGQFKKLLASVMPKFSLERIPPFDVVKVRAALSDLTRTREQTESQSRSDLQTLAILVFQNAETMNFNLKPIDLLPHLPGAEALRSCLGGPVASYLGSEKLGSGNSCVLCADLNPSLKVLSEQITVSELGLSATRFNRFPVLAASLEYGYFGPSPSQAAVGWNFTFGVRLPLFDWGVIAAQIEQENLNVLISKNKFEQQKQKIIGDFNQTLRLAKNHLEDQNRLKDLIPAVHQAAVASVERYKKGAMSILEATDSINLWLQTLMNERASFYAYLADLAALDRLLGRRPSEQIIYEKF